MLDHRGPGRKFFTFEYQVHRVDKRADVPGVQPIEQVHQGGTIRPFVDWIELTGLRVGQAVVKLRFTRKSEDNAAVEVVSVHGDNLDVVLVT